MAYCTSFPVHSQTKKSSADSVVNVGALLPSAGYVHGPRPTGTSRGRELRVTELGTTDSDLQKGRKKDWKPILTVFPGSRGFPHSRGVLSLFPLPPVMVSVVRLTEPRITWKGCICASPAGVGVILVGLTVVGTVSRRGWHLFPGLGSATI